MTAVTMAKTDPALALSLNTALAAWMREAGLSEKLASLLPEAKPAHAATVTATSGDPWVFASRASAGESMTFGMVATPLSGAGEVGSILVESDISLSRQNGEGSRRSGDTMIVTRHYEPDETRLRQLVRLLTTKCYAPRREDS